MTNIAFTKTTNRTFGQVLWDSDLEGNIDFSDGSLEIESPFNVQVPWELHDQSSNLGTLHRLKSTFL